MGPVPLIKMDAISLLNLISPYSKHIVRELCHRLVTCKDCSETLFACIYSQRCASSTSQHRSKPIQTSPLIHTSIACRYLISEQACIALEKMVSLSKQSASTSWQCNTSNRRLVDLASPVGSQEVVCHTHESLVLIGQHLPEWRLSPKLLTNQHSVAVTQG